MTKYTMLILLTISISVMSVIDIDNCKTIDQKKYIKLQLIKIYFYKRPVVKVVRSSVNPSGIHAKFLRIVKCKSKAIITSFFLYMIIQTVKDSINQKTLLNK